MDGSQGQTGRDLNTVDQNNASYFHAKHREEACFIGSLSHFYPERRDPDPAARGLPWTGCGWEPAALQVPTVEQQEQTQRLSAVASCSGRPDPPGQSGPPTGLCSHWCLIEEQERERKRKREAIYGRWSLCLQSQHKHGFFFFKCKLYPHTPFKKNNQFVRTSLNLCQSCKGHFAFKHLLNAPVFFSLRKMTSE